MGHHRAPCHKGGPSLAWEGRAKRSIGGGGELGGVAGMQGCIANHDRRSIGPSTVAIVFCAEALPRVALSPLNLCLAQHAICGQQVALPKPTLDGAFNVAVSPGRIAEAHCSAWSRNSILLAGSQKKVSKTPLQLK